ncbi:major facilitator superfamily domain-containing protein [Gilbertella persicaria]|uniref:major facilitator superfamily domain-containing protein n=1 Tax=Gilbertella persicaria TaxID=101096 RepID=UPI0022208EDB|nr:major facilitator superfamily domain-containing protein [Gilbertella persicaria]KAI8085890.1 major facilitator superfamily domain-containing protein [Gilbertella persicaria]
MTRSLDKSSGVLSNIDLENPVTSLDISRRRLFAIIASLCVVSFIAAFDNIIVASNTPLIATEFNGFGLYNWVNTAFLLTASTSQPMYGKCADMFGRRICFLFATASYLFGSVLCSAAQSMVMLIAARALCGLGIGAFDTLMKIVVADYIPVRYIGMYQSFLGISWGLGYVVGALVGGVAATNSGWRSVFWMALGFCVVALVLIFFAIEGPGDYDKKPTQLGQIDLVGILAWTVGVVCLVLGLSWGGTTYPWHSATIVALLCVAGVLLVFFGFYEHSMAQDPMIPRGIFTNRSTLLILIAAFCYGGCFQSLMTYVPLYLSVIRKEDAMASNLELLCLVLFACIFNVLTGLVIVKSGKYTWASRLSLSVLVLACGLLNLLDVQSSRGLIIGLMIVTGIGSGGMINSEIITAQASVAIEHVPTIVAFMTFCDQVGGITGITSQGSILSNTLSTRLYALNLPDVNPELVRQSSSYLWSLPEPTQTIVTQVYLEAVKMSFWGSFGFAAVGFVASLGLKAYVLRKDMNNI